jgi:VWFA-related protein
MRRRSATSILIAAGAVSLLRAAAGDFTLRSHVRLVVLDVAVRDRRGSPVAGLESTDFSVTENGKPQPITVFGREDLPVTMGILVDESYSMKPNRAGVLAAAEAFIKASNPRDEVFVLNFNDRVNPGLPGALLFSDNPAVLGSALRRGVPEGRTALYDAVAAGLTRLKLGARQRTVLVLISDGGDNASRLKRRDILDMTDASAATIHAIGLYDAADPERNTGFLREIAGISGGQAYFPSNPAELLQACDRIAKDIRSRYTVGYVPRVENGPPLRRIRVRVKATALGKLTVLARRTFVYDDALPDTPLR